MLNVSNVIILSVRPPVTPVTVMQAVSIWNAVKYYHTQAAAASVLHLHYASMASSCLQYGSCYSSSV